MGLGKEIQTYLEKNNMSIKKLSELSNVPYNTLYACIKRDSNSLSLPYFTSIIKIIYPMTDNEIKQACEKLESNAQTYNHFGDMYVDSEEKEAGQNELELLKANGVNYLEHLDEYITFLNSNGMHCSGEIASRYDSKNSYNLTTIEYKGKKYEVINDDLIIKRINLSIEAIDKIIENLVTSFKEI